MNKNSDICDLLINDEDETNEVGLGLLFKC